MNWIIAALKAMAKFAVLACFVLAAVIGLFVAWWIAVFAVLGLLAYVAVRRFFGARPRASEGSVVIEGEYSVHEEKERPRALDSTDGPPEKGPKNRLD
ncbi:MAG: hypothetical protein HYY28_05735 [Betaproteobacteria bacterium]|nr:hypothetical protein [Betaproteobacteria bacterium]